MSWWRRARKPEATVEEMRAYADACLRAKPGEVVMIPANASHYQMLVANDYIWEMQKFNAKLAYQRMADGIYLTST